MSSSRCSSDALLAEARRQIARVTPLQALELQRDGALIIDTRSERARESFGIVPGSMHVPRTVLEWRADAESPWRNPTLAGHRGVLIVICDHGWSSSLAALSLTRLGHPFVADVIGGIEAWSEAGLPMIEAPRNPLPPGELPGMGGPQGEVSL